MHLEKHLGSVPHCIMLKLRFCNSIEENLEPGIALLWTFYVSFLILL